LYQLDHFSEQVGPFGKVWNAGFEVLTAMVMKTSVFRDITSCNPLKVDRRSGGTWLQAVLAICFMLVSRVAYSSTLKLEKRSAKMSVHFQRTTRRYIPKTELVKIWNSL
jgi:hypothetical protein